MAIAILGEVPQFLDALRHRYQEETGNDDAYRLFLELRVIEQKIDP